MGVYGSLQKAGSNMRAAAQLRRATVQQREWVDSLKLWSFVVCGFRNPDIF